MGICVSKDNPPRKGSNSDSDLSEASKSKSKSKSKDKSKNKDKSKLRTSKTSPALNATSPGITTDASNQTSNQQANTTNNSQSNQNESTNDVSNVNNSTTTTASSPNRSITSFATSILQKTIENTHTIFLLTEEEVKLTCSNIITISHNGTAAMRRDLVIHALPYLLCAYMDLIDATYNSIGLTAASTPKHSENTGPGAIIKKDSTKRPLNTQNTQNKTTNNSLEHTNVIEMIDLKSQKKEGKDDGHGNGNGNDHKKRNSETALDSASIQNTEENKSLGNEDDTVPTENLQSNDTNNDNIASISQDQDPKINILPVNESPDVIEIGSNMTRENALLQKRDFQKTKTAPTNSTAADCTDNNSNSNLDKNHDDDRDFSGFDDIDDHTNNNVSNNNNSEIVGSTTQVTTTTTTTIPEEESSYFSKTVRNDKSYFDKIYNQFLAVIESKIATSESISAQNGIIPTVNTTTVNTTANILQSRDQVYYENMRELLIRAISQLVRCTRSDEHPVCITTYPEVLLMVSAVIRSQGNSKSITSAASILMHNCDLLRYIMATDEDRVLAVKEGVLTLLSDTIQFSTQLDKDNDLVKSAFQALLALGPAGEYGVFELVYESLAKYFLHSSVVNPALASIMSISSSPKGLVYLIDTEVCDLVSKSVTLFKDHKAIHAYARKVLRNKSKAGPDVGTHATSSANSNGTPVTDAVINVDK